MNDMETWTAIVWALRACFDPATHVRALVGESCFTLSAADGTLTPKGPERAPRLR